jgi:ribulose bisphosphate carboxylase small subunit
MATVLPFRTSTFARSIFLYGTNKLTLIPAEYTEPVKEYAAATYTQAQLDQALDQGFITQQEYNDTVAYKA